METNQCGQQNKNIAMNNSGTNVPRQYVGKLTILPSYYGMSGQIQDNLAIIHLCSFH